MKKTVLTILGIIMLLLLLAATKVFIIGSPADGSTLACDVAQTEDQINLYVTTPASAIAFSDVRLRQEGTALYITIREVLVSPLFDSGSRHIWIERNDLTKIYLGDRLVWEAS